MTEETDRLVAEYLAKGGKITKCPSGRNLPERTGWIFGSHSSHTSWVADENGNIDRRKTLDAQERREQPHGLARSHGNEVEYFLDGNKFKPKIGSHLSEIDMVDMVNMTIAGQIIRENGGGYLK